MKNKVKNIFLSFLLFLFLCPLKVFASGSATLSFNGSSNVYIGKNVEVTLAVSNVKVVDGIVAIGGELDYDTNYLELTSYNTLAKTDFVEYVKDSRMFAATAFSTSKRINSNTSLIKFVFKTKKTGSTTIKFNQPSITDGATGGVSSTVSTNVARKVITIMDPPSTNNNLSSLSVSVGSISFNKDTTNYRVNVDENVTSISINASAEDSKASVSGTGTKKLNLGDNTFKIVVKAPSGDTKTYTIVVNRKDNRSSNNNLSSLSISNGSINFNKNTTTYQVTVPYEVTSVSVNAKAEDSKSKVSISGGSNLKSEETQNVTVRVTAENGSVKTYTIKVTRAKDPNKPLSNDNNLKELVPSVGELSPKFDKDNLNYEISVEFDVKEISFTASPSETKYAKVDINGPEKLSVGKNKFTITVTAEDNSTKVYNVTVTRKIDPNAPASTNTNLGSLDISGGELTSKFNKDKHVYYYKGKLDIKAIPEDENSKVVVLEEDGVYTIFVEAPSGDVASYVIIPENNIVVPIVVSISGGFVLGFALKIGLTKFWKIRKKKKLA